MLAEEESAHTDHTSGASLRAARTMGRIAQYLGLAAALCEESGRRFDPLAQAEFDRNVAAARTRLGEEAFDAAWEEGRAMSVDEALELASSHRRHGGAHAPARQRSGELTARETEVASLVALGMTNAAIARRMVLSERTVEMHVYRAMQKLGVHTRTELAAWAIRAAISLPAPENQGR